MTILFGRPLHAAWLAVAATAWLHAPPAWADAAPPYDALLARLDRLPATQEAAALADAADGRLLQAQARPNPSLSIDAENAYGSGPYAGYRSADTVVSLSQPLELWGKRGARIDAARAEAGAAGLRREQARWATAGRLALVYADAEAAAQRQSLAEEALSLAEDDARAVRALVEQGREASLRGIQADSEIDAARAGAMEARAGRDAAFALLTAVALLERPVSAIGTSLLDRLPRAADGGGADALAVRVAQAERDAAGLLVAVEERRARPDVTASLGMTRFQDSREQAVSFGLSVSIPLFDRNTGAIQAAQAESRAAEARLAARRQDSRAARLAALAGLAASHSRTQAADSGVRAAQEAYRLARIGVEAGRISQLELRSSRAALVAARQASVDARLARVRAEIDLAGLEGRAPFGEAP